MKALELKIEMTISNEKAEIVLREARRRGVRPIDLMADAIERLIDDNLFTAILD